MTESTTNNQNNSLAKLNSIFLASLEIATLDSEHKIYSAGLKSIQDCGYSCAIFDIGDEEINLLPELESQMKLSRQIPSRLKISNKELITSFSNNDPVLAQDIFEPITYVPQTLLTIPKQMGVTSAAYIPLRVDQRLTALFVLGSDDISEITETTLSPISKLIALMGEMIKKLKSTEESQEISTNIKLLAQIGQEIHSENNLEKLFKIAHEQIAMLIGDDVFYVALFDEETQYISFPYVYEHGESHQVDSIPLGDGFTSVVIKEGISIMVIENAEEQAKDLGIKIVGPTAKSWLGVPLKVENNIIGAISIQDADREFRYSEKDLKIMETLATQISGAINNSRLVEKSQKRILQLETATQVAREISGLTDFEILLNQSVQLTQNRFGYYHVGLYLLDNSEELAVMRAGTGEAGNILVQQQHSFAVSSQSVVGHVSASGSPIIVHDVSEDPLFNFNSLLPDTKSEIGIPLKIGADIIGILNIHSTQPFAFSEDDFGFLQILADQLAVTIKNSELIKKSQENLTKQRVIQKISILANKAISLNSALKISATEMQSTLGSRVSILLLDPSSNKLEIVAAAGYQKDILGMQIDMGAGITGWAAETRSPITVGSVSDNNRYISSDEEILSEIAIPITYKDELIGILNIESEFINAFDEYDRELLTAISISLASIIIISRLTKRQRQLFEITNNIRRSVDIESILKTTSNELSRVLQARKVSIEIGIEETDKKQLTRKVGRGI